MKTLAGLRKACKTYGIKVKKETLTWGPHISFIIDGQKVSNYTSVHTSNFIERNKTALDGLTQIRKNFAGLTLDGEHVYGIQPEVF